MIRPAGGKRQDRTVGGSGNGDENQVSHCNDHGIKLQMTGLDDSNATDVAIAGNTVRDVGGHAILLTYTGLTGPSTWNVSPSVTGNTCARPSGAQPGGCPRRSSRPCGDLCSDNS